MLRNISVWIDNHKVLVAFIAVGLLVAMLVFFRDPVTAVWTAGGAGVLVLGKEIIAGIGKAKAADELDKLARADGKKKSQRAADIEKSKRNYDVWSSICGMFAAILGVPAAVSVVEKLVQ